MNRKGLLLVLLCGFLFLTGYGQGAPEIPAFKILRSNNRFFTADELPKNKPVLLIYFAPDCGHCLDLLNPFFKQMNKFNQATVVLVTFRPLNELALFEQTYRTATYPNLVVGTEGSTQFLRSFYKIQKTPFVALYNKQGKLVQVFRNEPSVNELLAGLKGAQ